MTYDQCREILENLRQMNMGIACIAVKLNSDGIIGRKTSFEYLDLQIETLREYVDETAKIMNKELRESES